MKLFMNELIPFSQKPIKQIEKHLLYVGSLQHELQQEKWTKNDFKVENLTNNFANNFMKARKNNNKPTRY